LHALRAEQVVAVHVNDLMPGVAMQEQTAGVRALPGEHGLVDIGAFLLGLQDIGYDGPITAEPTHPKWRDIRAEDAARMTRDAIQGCLDRAGVSSIKREPTIGSASDG